VDCCSVSLPHYRISFALHRRDDPIPVLHQSRRYNATETNIWSLRMYLTDKKVAVMGAGGMIGSNMVQDLLSTGTANNIAMYDPFEMGLEGAAEEIYHCAFPGANVTW